MKEEDMIDVSLVSSKFMITEKGRPAGMRGVFSLHNAPKWDIYQCESIVCGGKVL